MNRVCQHAHDWIKNYFFLVSLFFYIDSIAQENVLSISPEYNIPLGKLAWSYKASPGIQLKYSLVARKNRNFQSGLSFGYTALQPLADTLYYVVDRGGVGGVGIGTATFSPFKMIQITGTMNFEFPVVKKKLSINLGLGIGIIYGSREMIFEDSFGAIDDSAETVGWASMVSKAGLEYKITNNFSLSPYISYTFMIQTGNTDSNAIDYNPGTGAISNFYSPGMSISYSF